MRTLMDLQLDTLEHMLGRHAESIERTSLMSTLHRRAARRLEGCGQMVYWDSAQSVLIEHAKHYLFQLRLEKIQGIQYWMPFSFVFRLDPARGDVCDEHLKSSKPLCQTWTKCNDCYLRYHKNEICLQIKQGLTNIIELLQNLSDPQYRPYILAMQFFYCAEIMQLLICGVNDPQGRILYLQARTIALSVLQELRNMPEIAPQPHANMLSNFYNFCLAPVAGHRSVMPDPNQIQLNRNNAGM